jgi:hypothetical protein
VLRELYHDSLIFFHADGRRRYVWVSLRLTVRRDFFANLGPGNDRTD